MYITAKESLVFLILFQIRCSFGTIHFNAPPSRIIFVSIAASSHVNSLISIARAFPEHHNITFAVFDINIETVREKLRNSRQVTFLSFGRRQNSKQYYYCPDGVKHLKCIDDTVLPSILNFYAPIHKTLFEHLQNNPYHLMVVDIFALAAQDLAHEFRIPMIIRTGVIQFVIPDVPAWIPHGQDAATPTELQNSFSQRFTNHIVFPILNSYYFARHIKHLNDVRRTFNRSVSSPLFYFSHPNQHSKRYPVLITSPRGFEFRHSHPINFHFTGFIFDYQDHFRDRVESVRIESWINETKTPDEFVVLVTFGTLTITTVNIWCTIIKTINEVPNMRLLLTIPQSEDQEKIQDCLSIVHNQQSRILVVPWVPQQLILTNPAVRIFITHGGINSIGEAIYAHVPLIILPGFVDQYANGAKVEEKKIGHIIDRNSISSFLLAAKIKQIHSDHDQYVARLIQLHQISELEGGGAKQAAKLIDGWLLTGYAHVLPMEHELHFLVANSLDVWLTLLLLLIFACWILLRFIKCLLRSCKFSRTKVKQA